jgi:adenylosuccinate synthase
VLSYLDKIPVITQYRVNGELTDRFPFPAALNSAEAVVEYVDGWNCDISGARSWEDLPEAARSYIDMIEKYVGCPVTFISVGAERDSIIIR